MSDQVRIPQMKKEFNKEPMSHSNLPMKPKLNQPANSDMS